MTDTSVTVALGDRSYDIHIGPGLLDRAADMIRALLPRPRLVVVQDEAVAVHGTHLQQILGENGIETLLLSVRGGESAKSFNTLNWLCTQLLDAHVERGDMIACLGGGVIGDLGGFAAAILRRGIDFIQIPTTLLAQVDSSVGGKTGINMAQGKNLVGTFHQPRLVLIDPETLTTLPTRQRRAGLAEVIKYGLIDDPDFFAWQEDHQHALLAGKFEPLSHAIAQSCRAKARIVAADERERGTRALLNLGHTFGHAIEALGGYDGRVLHGEAVALGMAMAMRYSNRLGLCPDRDVMRAEQLLQAASLPVRADACAVPLDPDAMLAAMIQDKKTQQGRITLILCRGIGQAFIHKQADQNSLKDFLTEECA